VALAVLTAACSAGADETTSASPVDRFIDDYSAASGYDDLVARTADECMAAAGFRYDFAAARDSGPTGETPSTTFPGFGMSTRYESPGEYLTGPERFVSAAEVDYFVTLDPVQQARYLRRLYIGATGLDGCLSLAFEAGFELRPAALDQLQEKVLASRLDAAGELAATPSGNWPSCMADKGFDYGSPDDLLTDLGKRLDGIAGRFGESPLAALIQQDPNYRADPIPEEAYDTAYPPFLALQEYELRVAEASAACGVDPAEVQAGAETLRGGGPLMVTREEKESEVALLRDMASQLRPLAESVGLDFDTYLN